MNYQTITFVSYKDKSKSLSVSILANNDGEFIRNYGRVYPDLLKSLTLVGIE